MVLVSGNSGAVGNDSGAGTTRQKKASIKRRIGL